MTINPRVVFDTNVLISAALSRRGTSRKALDWGTQRGIILSSDETIQELISRLQRPKFDGYVDADQPNAYIEWLILHTDSMEVTETVEVCRDPDDDKFLELAVSDSADVIISGDGDLTALHPFRGIPILTPDEFLESDFVEE